MKPRGRLFFLSGLSLVLIGLWLPFAAAAQQSNQLLVDCNKIVSDGQGNVTIDHACTIKDFFDQFVRLAAFGYGILTVLAILMFVYGGFQFLTAGGRQEKVSEGRRVISGTIIGLAISLSAYVIINFTVSAVTGLTARSLNPFGGIALVFTKESGLQQPFSGNQGDQISACRTNWDNTCSNQVYCSDPGSTPGPVYREQSALNAMGCQCGTPDGCFGALTVGCVRRLQIANLITPSGVLDQNTMRYLQPYLDALANNDTAAQTAAINNYGCTRSSLPGDFVSAISSQLPSPNSSYATIRQASATTTGCCLVRKTIGGAVQPYYCVNQIDERACTGLAGNTVFDSGQDCASAPDMKDVCGLCANLSAGRCFDGSGQYWCQQVVNPPQSFSAGRCPDPRCSSSCDDGLRSTLSTPP